MHQRSFASSRLVPSMRRLGDLLNFQLIMSVLDRQKHVQNELLLRTLIIESSVAVHFYECILPMGECAELYDESLEWALRDAGCCVIRLL